MARRTCCLTNLLILKEADVAAALTAGDAFSAVERALRAQADQKTINPLRAAVVVPNGLLGSMPGAIMSDPASIGAKLVTFFPGNAQRDRHTHQALIALFDPQDGRPIVLMDGRLITEIRTAAVSAVATRELARSGAKSAAILGTGVQARAHAHALALVMELEELRIWGRNRLRAETLARELREQGLAARATDTPHAACENADVICTVTSSSEPVLTSSDVAAGAHINAVGACTPRMRELPADLMAQASIFVDSIEGALHEAGDITQAIAEGALPPMPRLTLLADVVGGKTLGRTTPEEITLFKSLGIAIEDLACASIVYERGSERGLGTHIDL